MKRTMITLISVAVLMSVTAGTGSAATIWRGGDIACSYAQFPIGSFAGAFISTGTMITEEGQFLPSGSAAAAAGVAGGWSLGLFGITQGEVQGEVDLIVLVVNSDTGIPEPGTWTGSLADDTVFAVLMLGVRDLVLPTGLDPAGLEDLLGTIDADHKFFGVSSEVTIDVVGDTQLSGTFSGMFADESLLVISIADGTFVLADGVTPTETATWSSVKSRWR